MTTNYDIIPMDPGASVSADWLSELTEPHWMDIPGVFVGVPASFAAGGYLGMFVYTTGYIVMRVTMTTPLAKMISRWVFDSFTVRLNRRLTIQANFYKQAGPIYSPSQPLAHQSADQSFQRPAASSIVDPAAISCGYKVLPGFVGRQIVVYGPTGSGKSSVLKALIMHRQKDDIVVIDPKYKPGNWPSRSMVIGGGLNWEQIDEGLTTLLNELKCRVKALGQGVTDFRPLTIAVDELSILTQYVPDAGTRLIQLAQLGREVKMFTILTPHSTEVEQMGFQGKGNARENFVYIGLESVNPLDEGAMQKPRIVTVHMGNPRRKGNYPLGDFIVPYPRIYTGRPRFRLFLSGVSDNDQAVSQSMSQPVSADVSVSQTRVDTVQTQGFSSRYKPGNVETMHLVEYLVQHGYGTRKIGEFLPFAVTQGREMARQAMSETKPGSRPPANTDAEKDLVLHLAAQFGAPAHRIARLLDGNDQVSLERISRYLTRV
jgi:hypothetical protein